MNNSMYVYVRQIPGYAADWKFLFLNFFLGFRIFCRGCVRSVAGSGGLNTLGFSASTGLTLVSNNKARESFEN